MNIKTTPKKDIYLAIGFALLLVISAFPFAILGMRMLNFILG
jgi:hypothetical protein